MEDVPNALHIQTLTYYTFFSSIIYITLSSLLLLLSLKMFVAVYCLVLIISFERILLYKGRKLLNRKGVNMCAFQNAEEKRVFATLFKKMLF